MERRLTNVLRSAGLVAAATATALLASTAAASAAPRTGAQVSGAGAAASAPSALAADCDVPPVGSMCVHIHNTANDSWYWYGPWYSCVIHNFTSTEMPTWINNNQTGGVRTTFYYGRDGGGGAIGSVSQDYSGRPPGYKSADYSAAYSVRVC
ncbi:hypothetical protein ACIQI7_00295 [Kitasatospora sp. NPDC092039]|uniref:hypothetical protein n=1 Tax=Kitasatospora sp. NPDC092039 TaxID=3364086 RepID=UPI003813DE7D